MVDVDDFDGAGKLLGRQVPDAGGAVAHDAPAGRSIVADRPGVAAGDVPELAGPFNTITEFRPPNFGVAAGDVPELARHADAPRGADVGNCFLAEKADGEELTDDDEDVPVLFAPQAVAAIARGPWARTQARARTDPVELPARSPGNIATRRHVRRSVLNISDVQPTRQQR